MRNGLRAGRIFGIPIVVDVSWVIIAALVTIGLRMLFDDLRGVSPVAAWIAAVAGAMLFFGSVLVHELSHSYVALRRGIRVRRIRLFIFGGVSEIEQDSPTPQDELAVTIAGPVSSLMLAVVFGLLSMPVDGAAPPTQGVLRWLAAVNLLLGVFNLLPGFPLDGGRVLRSIIWRRTGSILRATRIAAAGGRVLAGLMIVAGIVILIMVGPSGLWYMFLGWFLMRAASETELQTALGRGLGSATVGDVMHPETRSVSPALPVTSLLEATGGRRARLAVIDPWGRPVGVVDSARLDDLPPSKLADLRVAEIMQRLMPGEIVSSDQQVAGLRRPSGDVTRMVLVMDGDRPLGVLGAEDVDRWLGATAQPSV